MRTESPNGAGPGPGSAASARKDEEGVGHDNVHGRRAGKLLLSGGKVGPRQRLSRVPTRACDCANPACAACKHAPCMHAAGLAGAISRTATAPVDRLKLLLQVQESAKPMSIWEGVQKMRKEGECVRRETFELLA